MSANTAAAATVRAALGQWRDSLVNLTARNRLLNFKGSRSSSVEIGRPNGAIVLEGLSSGVEFSFRSLAAPEDVVPDDESARHDRNAAGADPEDVRQVADERQLPPVSPYILDSWKDEPTLTAALRSLLRRSTAEYMDRGVWVLYLAFGMLTWTDEDDQRYRSPLLLVPVRLLSPGPKQRPTLALGDEDAAVNPALVLRLAQFGVILPTLDEVDEDFRLEEFSDLVRSAVAGRDGWDVTDDVVLSYFSFHKEAMYRDLIDHEDAVAEHPIVGALAAGARYENVDAFAFDEIGDERIDDDAPPESTPLVLDADSSQRACIAAAVEGHSFVMDGPPGTGKSQTIANMVGALMAAGRTVLFVSEKAAALEVVRNRLTESGLGNYVLELHSHKATRREVATVLGHTLENVPVPPVPMPARERERALRRRQELNAFAEAMNAPRHPLGYTLHDVLGRIALLNTTPAAPSTGVPPSGLTIEILDAISEAAHALARAWRPALQGQTYLWRDVTDRASLDARLYRARRALSTLRGIVAANEPIVNAFSWTRPSDASPLADFLDHLARRPPNVPLAWFTGPTIEPITTDVAQLVAYLNEIRQRQQVADDAAGATWQLIPADDESAVADASPTLPRSQLIGGALSPDEAEDLADRLTNDANMLEQCQTTLQDVASALGVPHVATFDDARDTIAVAALTYDDARPESTWLSLESLAAARAAHRELLSATQSREEAQTAACAYYTDAVLQADVEGLAQRLACYHGLGKWSGACRADKKIAAALARPGVGRDDALANLDRAIRWKHSDDAYITAAATHGPRLGRYHQSGTTDFAMAARALDNTNALLSRARTTNLATLAAALGGATSELRLRSAVTHVSRRLDEWAESLGTPSYATTGASELIEGGIDSAIGWLKQNTGVLRASAAYARRAGHALGRSVALSEGEHLRSLRSDIDAARNRLSENEPIYQHACGSLYTGEQTDLKLLAAALNWTVQLRDLVGGPLTLEQVKSLDYVVQTPPLRDAINSWAITSRDIIGAFAPTRHSELKSDLNDYSEGCDILDALAEDGAGHTEWLAYAEARATLARHGLDTAVQFCIAERIPPTAVPQVLERALLQEWADDVLARDPALAAVRATDREALVEEYRALDRKLIASATSQIITDVNARRPRSDLGEAAIIRREAAKKRKHMPVRTLIDRTKHVIQAIKPCFMMSPLSVSQYLPADLRFDTVIFDEASQVSPSDAINCIYRGKALVVAGDQKQLPPTSFFEAGAVDDSEEWSEDDLEDATDFQSILDLVKGSGSFKSLTLRWHYRSRHENLIAFSNASFYEGKLITFPGAEIEGPHVGVELITVDGVYRRGSSRDNPVEALKVAERVIHHFENRPNMSLGVVTFSEAQAATIEDAVENALVTRPDLQRFFAEDRLGGFFVKNLESVQGDERDVMIFSIGYGRDENGKLTNNFGPVNKPGGWRRLNVAVTRARCRNEIVSSITAADITDTGANEGVRHLRRYLDYAARGIAALALDTPAGRDAESRFEESVIQAIRSWGYDLTPQVGSAGYRIDIGVHHPDHPNAYVLGIECDGLMYHSAKAARDRDRLREQVLRGLGWNLHRIWGTAWYRNRASEEARLRHAIERASNLPLRGLLPEQPQSPDHIERPDVFVATASFDGEPEWAQPYTLAAVHPLPAWLDPGEPAALQDTVAAIEAIASVEGPVHISIIHQRLREAWNIGRIGSRIRDVIDAATRRAEVTRAGDYVDVPQRDRVNVRTPVPGCERTVEQVASAELATALIGCARDCVGATRDELTTAVARLYGWNRRGNGIQGRLDALVEELVRTGTLMDDDGVVALA